MPVPPPFDAGDEYMLERMPRLQQSRRQRPVDEDEDVDMHEPQDDQYASDGAADETMNGPPNEELSQLIKGLVRYAIACDFSRTPIRRDAIREKGLCPFFSFFFLSPPLMIPYILTPSLLSSRYKWPAVQNSICRSSETAPSSFWHGNGGASS